MLPNAPRRWVGAMTQFRSARRLKASWRAKRDKANKKVMTSRVPAWLYVEDGEIKVNEERAAVIRRIFELSIKGAWFTNPGYKVTLKAPCFRHH